MNLHVTSDHYGLYPLEIAKRIKGSVNSSNNLIVNLFSTSFYKDNLITYIPATNTTFKKYISNLVNLDKIIFHPYNLTGYRFLKFALKKFPNATVYWMCWSSELYRPHLKNYLYDAFSVSYLKRKTSLIKLLKDSLKKIIYKTPVIGNIKKEYKIRLQHSYLCVHYFCSPFYSDFLFLQTITPGIEIKYLSIAYFSVDTIMHGLQNFHTSGNKIMIGHSASPEGNHYEIIHKLSKINPGYPILLPLAYGNKEYGNLIKMEAHKKLINVEVLEKNLERNMYYKKLTEVGWAIINVKVQQAVGNIIALIWMGCKVFLDKNTSTYKDFLDWGIDIYSIQDNLNESELSNKLSPEQIENNRKKIIEKFNEETVNKAWNEFLY